MARKKCPECPKCLPSYLATYGDMVTLLLTFFVMLFTVATIDGREFRLILSSFRGSMGIFEGGQTLSKGDLEEMGMNLEALPATEKGTALSKSYQIASEIFKPEIKSKQIKLKQDERGLIISLIGNDHFPPGSARLTETTKNALVKVGGLLIRLNSLVRIEGHADETPLATNRGSEYYETNWELSSQRSINVLRFLHESENVDPAMMSAVSYGKYRPLTESKTPEGRAINRRVDIVVLTNNRFKRGYSDDSLPGEKVPQSEWQFR